ncbi:MAG: M81 family metallopeptidase [Myxococcota bacterium]
MTLRIAYGRIMQETNALSPVDTTLADFERAHLYEGDALARRVTSPLAHEVDGFARNAELSGFHRALRKLAPKGAIATVPLVSAWAISGGPLAEDCLGDLTERLCRRLRDAGPVDGVFLALHGAMGARGVVDPEARILAEVRRVVGPRVPIACTFDLHGLLTSAKMAELDFLAAYHTNPHRDHAATGARAGAMLIDTLLGRPRPARAWRAIPMITGGGAGVDFMRPSSALFGIMRRMARNPAVRDVSLFLCHPWNDHPELGWSAAVFADSEVVAERLADQLAEAAWSVRHIEPPRFLGPDEAIAKVRAARVLRKLGTACVCDASDVVGAGGTGENTNLLAALIERAGDLVSYVPLRDADAVEALWDAPVGAPVDVEVGGHLDPASNPPLRVRGRLHARDTSRAFGRRVAIDAGPVKLVLTEGAPLVMQPSFYASLGLDPWRADVCVVKSYFPFRIFFAAQNRMSLYVKTRGITDLDRAPTARPLTDWRAEDKRRRRTA